MKLFNFLCSCYEQFKVVESFENSRVDSNLTTTTLVSVEIQKKLRALPSTCYRNATGLFP